MQSWKDDRLDLAEHMHTKATQHLPSADTATRTALVMLLSQIGHSLIARTHLDAAAPWFRRAAAAEPASRFLPTRGGACDRLPTAVEAQQELLQAARLAATNGLLKCLTGVRSCEYMEEASRVVESAAGEFGGHRLEVREMAAMVQAAMSDYNGLAASLYDIISNLSHFLEKNMSLDSVLGHIDKMRKIDTDTAAGLLDEMISQLISARAQIGTLNNAVVMRLTIFLQNPEKETIWDCFELLDCLLDSTNILNSHSAQQVHSVSTIATCNFNLTNAPSSFGRSSNRYTTRSNTPKPSPGAISVYTPPSPRRPPPPSPSTPASCSPAASN